MENVIKISKCKLGRMIKSVDSKVYLFNIYCKKNILQLCIYLHIIEVDLGFLTHFVRECYTWKSVSGFDL